MIKTLTKHGNSLALVIDRAVLDLLRIDAETTLDISTDGRTLIITPVAGTLPRRRQASDSNARAAPVGDEEIEPRPGRGPRVLGLHLGNMVASADFDDPLPDDFWLGST